MRIGQATDIHALVEGRPLILGGVTIPHTKGLLGHSDADALVHAIAEALLGALALGDLGHHFPDTDSQWKDAHSLDLLARVVTLVENQGYHLHNVDSTILIEKPKMAPYIEAMRENIARVCHCPISSISIKATRGEGLGFIGHEEGVLAQAVVLLEENA